MNSGQGSFMLGIKSVLQFICNVITGAKERKLASKRNEPCFHISNKSFEENCSLHALGNTITTRDIVNKHPLHLQLLLYSTMQIVLLNLDHLKGISAQIPAFIWSLIEKKASPSHNILLYRACCQEETYVGLHSLAKARPTFLYLWFWYLVGARI